MGFQAEPQHLLHNFGTQIPLGGVFPFFTKNRPQNHQKTCHFAYLTGQWGGARATPPGYATSYRSLKYLGTELS